MEKGAGCCCFWTFLPRGGVFLVFFSPTLLLAVAEVFRVEQKYSFDYLSNS